MEHRAIFLDIDGTLTEPGRNEPPQSAVRAIQEARAQGNYVFLCTGRNYDMLLPLLKYPFDGIVASSGGYIQCGKEIIYDCPMTEEQKNLAMEVLERHGIFRTVECMDGSYTDEGFKEFLRKNSDQGSNSEMLRWREQVERALHILPMKEYRGQPVYKIVMVSPTREQLEEPLRLLTREFSVCIQEENRNGFVNGEIVSRQFDKGRAVERVCTHLQVPIQDSIAIGDSMNDKEMLEKAGLGICMENGSESLKRLADDVCPSVRENGIYRAFKKYHLI